MMVREAGVDPEARTRAAEREAILVAVYEAHYTRLLRFAYLLSGGRDAEDLVQETVVRALRRWDHTAAIETFLPWAHTTLLRLFLNRRKRAKYEDRYVAMNPAGSVASTEPDIDVVRAVAALPPRQRAAVLLRYYEDASEAQIAEHLRCRPGTVKALLHQARERLRLELNGPRD